MIRRGSLKEVWEGWKVDCWIKSWQYFSFILQFNECNKIIVTLNYTATATQQLIHKFENSQQMASFLDRMMYQSEWPWSFIIMQYLTTNHFHSLWLLKRFSQKLSARGKWCCFYSNCCWLLWLLWFKCATTINGHIRDRNGNFPHTLNLSTFSNISLGIKYSYSSSQ